MNVSQISFDGGGRKVTRPLDLPFSISLLRTMAARFSSLSGRICGDVDLNSYACTKVSAGPVFFKAQVADQSIHGVRLLTAISKPTLKLQSHLLGPGTKRKTLHLALMVQKTTFTSSTRSFGRLMER
jgi:hypothetical protein